MGVQANIAVQFQANTTAEILGFPSGLGGSAAVSGSPSPAHMPFVIFRPYLRAGLRTVNSNDFLDDKIPDPRFSIALPLPTSALQTNYSVDYEEVELGSTFGLMANHLKNEGLAGAMVNLATAGVVAGGASLLINDLIGGYAPKTSSTLSKFITAGAITGGVGGVDFLVQGLGKGGIAVVEEALNGAPVGKTLKRATGLQENPFTETLFKTVQFRTHNFNYQFYPRNADESKTLDRIIGLLKFHMMPASAVPTGMTDEGAKAGAWFSFPYEFSIAYSVKNTTFELMPSVLTSLNVSYSPDSMGAPRFFAPDADGKQYPAAVGLSMAFKEVILITRDRMDVENSARVSDLQLRNAGSVSHAGDISRTRYRF